MSSRAETITPPSTPLTGDMPSASRDLPPAAFVAGLPETFEPLATPSETYRVMVGYYGGLQSHAETQQRYQSRLIEINEGQGQPVTQAMREPLERWERQAEQAEALRGIVVRVARGEDLTSADKTVIRTRRTELVHTRQELETRMAQDATTEAADLRIADKRAQFVRLAEGGKADVIIARAEEHAQKERDRAQADIDAATQECEAHSQAEEDDVAETKRLFESGEIDRLPKRIVAELKDLRARLPELDTEVDEWKVAFTGELDDKVRDIESARDTKIDKIRAEAQALADEIRNAVEVQAAAKREEIITSAARKKAASEQKLSAVNQEDEFLGLLLQKQSVKPAPRGQQSRGKQKEPRSTAPRTDSSEPTSLDRRTDALSARFLGRYDDPLTMHFLQRRSGGIAPGVRSLENRRSVTRTGLALLAVAAYHFGPQAYDAIALTETERKAATAEVCEQTEAAAAADNLQAPEAAPRAIQAWETVVMEALHRCAIQAPDKENRDVDILTTGFSSIAYAAGTVLSAGDPEDGFLSLEDDMREQIAEDSGLYYEKNDPLTETIIDLRTINMIAAELLSDPAKADEYDKEFQESGTQNAVLEDIAYELGIEEIDIFIGLNSKDPATYQAALDRLSENEEWRQKLAEAENKLIAAGLLEPAE